MLYRIDLVTRGYTIGMRIRSADDIAPPLGKLGADKLAPFGHKSPH